MNIKEYINHLKTIRGDKSFAFLAERCETDAENPYRIRPAAPVKADETLVLVLCGANRDNYDHIREYNGYLKQVDDFVKQSPKLKDKKVRVCVAVCNFGKYHNTDAARELQHLKFSEPETYEDIITTMSPEAREEMLNPAYIQDIFDAAYMPRISHNNSIRQSHHWALANMRRLNIVAHCHGSYVAMALEDKLMSQTKKLGYSYDEQDKLVAQQLVLNFNPECAKHHARSQFVCLQSAADTHNPYTTYMEEYLLMKPQDFGLLYAADKNINTLMCAQVDKRGIEGNPPRVWIARPIEEVMREAHEARVNAVKNETKEPEEEKFVGEHSFMGFTPKANMSKSALKMQGIARNILENGVANSLQQKLGESHPLPSFMSLAANDNKERFELVKAYFTGHKISLKVMAVRGSKLAQHNAYRCSHTIEL